jgi:DNA (cytosine-5)-methyltransferase 1
VAEYRLLDLFCGAGGAAMGYYLTETRPITDCPICYCYPKPNITENTELRSKFSERKCPVCGKNCGKPALLDLFCGAGGAARGYQKAGFCVLGVDIKPQPHYAGCRFVQADALTYPLEGFDAYHASPPCQGYSTTKNCSEIFGFQEHPLYIGDVRQILESTGKPFVIENVMNAKYNKHRQEDGLQAGFLCGLMFGKPFYRHRLFETNFAWFQPGHPKHRLKDAGSYGAGVKSCCMTLMHNLKVIRDSAAKHFETEWMNGDELSEAIPVCYTEYIGKYLIQHLENSK